MDLDDFNVGQKEKETVSLKTRVDQATADIERMNLQLLALTDEYEEKLKQRRIKFKEKYDERFKDVNVKAALVGALARWSQVFAGISYFFEMPSGAWNAEINAFLNTPRSVESVSDATNGVTKDVTFEWAPIQPEEVVLLKILTGIQVAGQQETAFKGKAPWQRLRVIRAWPAALIGALADRAVTFESYLNVCLELDLGN